MQSNHEKGKSVLFILAFIEQNNSIVYEHYTLKFTLEN